MKKIVCLTAALLGSGLSARASELNIYPSFAEVRETVQLNGEQFDWTPPADLGSYLQPESLELDDPNVLFMSLLPPTPSLLEMFEGKEVQVWFNEEYVTATVVSANVGMFKIGNSYVQIASSQVLYPNLEGWRIAATYSWQRAPVVRTAQLQYRTRGVQWLQTRYTLGLNQDENTSAQANLTAWADIKNESLVRYTAVKATLFAGFSASANDSSVSKPKIVATAPVTTRPKIISAGEVAGLQKFEYPNKFTLAGRTTMSLPFVKSQPQVKRVLEYSNQFYANANLQTGLLRMYRFKAEQILPQGEVTLRENGQLIGAVYLENTALGSNVKLNFGKDFDTKLVRSAQLLERITSRTQIVTKYKINFLVKNIKTRAVNIRLNEWLCETWKFSAAPNQGFVFSNNSFVLERELAAGQTLAATLIATKTVSVPMKPVNPGGANPFGC